MNCEEYRLAIAADPSREDGNAHAAACPHCRAHRDELRALDRRIGRALQISVPELRMPDLPDVDTSSVVALPARRRFTSPAWLAVAATLVLAAFVGIRMIGDNVTYASLADEIVAHLDHEPYALRVTDEPVSERRLAKVVPAEVASMNHDAGLITYAQTCVINGKKVPHLVIQGEHGPVTILLLPDEAVDDAVELEGESINGVLLPVGGGSVAIIGEKDEKLESIRQNVMNSVTWST
jgi:anti-sigma factor RsiW